MSALQTDCAIYLAQGPELRLVWANDTYLSYLQEPYRSGAMGMRLDEVSAVASLRADALREVIRTGEPQGGEDRSFSVEDGVIVFDWRAYRPFPDHVLVVILSRRPGDVDGT